MTYMRGKSQEVLYSIIDPLSRNLLILRSPHDGPSSLEASSPKRLQRI